MKKIIALVALDNQHSTKVAANCFYGTVFRVTAALRTCPYLILTHIRCMKKSTYCVPYKQTDIFKGLPQV